MRLKELAVVILTLLIIINYSYADSVTSSFTYNDTNETTTTTTLAGGGGGGSDKVSVPATCGNKVCDTKETQKNCPSDCCIPVIISDTVFEIKVMYGIPRQIFFEVENLNNFSLRPKAILVKGGEKDDWSMKWASLDEYYVDRDMSYYLVEDNSNETVRVYINMTDRTASGRYQFLVELSESVCNTTYTIPVNMRVRQRDESWLDLTFINLGEKMSETAIHLRKPEPNGVTITWGHIVAVIGVILFIVLLWKFIAWGLGKNSKKKVRYY